eukprot:TRINITY_DN22035_c0_g1_i1.p1 TRINITY_DN22035_c0_g1~~TRINITY_DN22035_c0_g1_i1.p1  ORF type:complete len:617 (+),score=177.71 TRINITY_DN22035_c0_g1_i1:77-1852(+)
MDAAPWRMPEPPQSWQWGAAQQLPAPAGTAAPGDAPQPRKLNAHAKPFAGSQGQPRQHRQHRRPPPTAAGRPPQSPPPTTVGHRQPPAERQTTVLLPLRPGMPPTEIPAVTPTVTTPWYPLGTEKTNVTLGDEIARLCALHRLTPREQRERRTAVAAIADAARHFWGPETVTSAYGSFAAGTAWEDSTVDVIVEHCRQTDQGAVCAVASSAGDVLAVLCENGGAFTQVKIKGTGVVANVTFAAGANPTPGRAVAMVRGWLSEFPCIASVYVVLRQVLSQTNNLDVGSGGMSSHCLMAMIAACCRGKGHYDAVSLLIDFCSTFGGTWDYAAASVDPATGEPKPRQHPGDILSVLDPITPGNNLAAGCTRLFAVCAQLQHCATALQRWDSDLAAGRKGYKGKTPLSSIVSHQKLYARAAMKAKAAEDGDVEPEPPRRYARAQLLALRDARSPVPETVLGLSEIYCPFAAPSPDRSVFGQAPQPDSGAVSSASWGRSSAVPWSAGPTPPQSGPSSPARTLRHVISSDSIGHECDDTPPRDRPSGHCSPAELAAISHVPALFAAAGFAPPPLAGATAEDMFGAPTLSEENSSSRC